MITPQIAIEIPETMDWDLRDMIYAIVGFVFDLRHWA
jgi:hypothetical protein